MKATIVVAALSWILVAKAAAGVLGPVAVPVNAVPIASAAQILETFAYPRYQFGYAVNDVITGDNKNRVEARDGHLVGGEYTVVDPNGSVRHTSYGTSSPSLAAFAAPVLGKVIA